MEFILIKKDCPEWDYIWNWIANHPINKDLPDPMDALNEGEQWQYIGSFKHNDKVIHSMRHRYHPVTQGVKNLSLTASEAMNDESILPKK